MHDAIRQSPVLHSTHIAHELKGPWNHEVSVGDLLDRVDMLRVEASRLHTDEEKASLGQYLTGASTARLMASMLICAKKSIHLLDPGAGVGSLLAAVVEELISRDKPPLHISASAYEIDPVIMPYLEHALELCRRACEKAGVEFRGVAYNEDFIEHASNELRRGSGNLFSASTEESHLLYDAIILNPPYYKINADGRERKLLANAGIETSNIYTGFLWACTRLLASAGEMVSITPRSFANGSYHAGFRRALLHNTILCRLHVFDSRKQAFKADAVLQENVIAHMVRSGQAQETSPGTVVISSSAGPDDDLVSRREAAYAEVVDPTDPEYVIHIVIDGASAVAAASVRALEASLSDLNIQVSTGRVVHFRVKEYLNAENEPGAAPLIWPEHLRGGMVSWPRADGRKPQSMRVSPIIANQFVPSTPGEYYVLTKRFSSKEERRRIMASLYDPSHVDAPDGAVGFENHVNYYHRAGHGLPKKQAMGLTAFLNSTLLDSYYRNMSGHTQVNATDLRGIRYPTLHQLESIADNLQADRLADQEAVDAVMEEVLGSMQTRSGEGSSGQDPVKVRHRIEEAIAVLRDLGLPKAQQNERSALVLLSLLNLGPDQPWSAATGDSLMRVTDIIDRIAELYAKLYAENSRETLRRQTLHQFRAAGLVLHNPDDPTRPINSGKNAYQIAPSALELLLTYGTPEWSEALQTYLTTAGTLAERWSQSRRMERISLTIEGRPFTLSPGGQNVLVKEIVEQFAPRWTPNGLLIYVGDTETKWAYLNQEALANLGVTVNPHGQFPDIIVYMPDRNWIILIEAVTSHGPVNPKRREELLALFADSSAGLVFVTAFLTREAMRSYLPEIAWETEVWVADAPEHLIHFNGTRFLGPYE